MYNLISLPRNTLKMTEKLICESLEKTQQTRGFEKCQNRTAKKRGHSPVPFGTEDSSWLGRVSSHERLQAPLLEQKASALQRDQVFQTEKSLGHPHRCLTRLRRVPADSLAQCDSFIQGAEEQQLGSWQPPNTQIPALGDVSGAEPPGWSWADGDCEKMKWEGVAITVTVASRQAPRSTPAACSFWNISALYLR